MLKQLALIMLAVFVLTGCNALQEESADSQEVEEVVQQATEIPVMVDPTSESIVVEPTIEASSEPIVVEATIAPTVEPVIEPTIEPTAEPVTNAYNAPEWTTIPLMNARTGETFTLADFAGKTVFVEPMATWCPNCRTQQGFVSQAMASLNSDDFVFISLSVGENVSNEVLAGYADRNSFPQIFVVADTEISNALVEQFGFSIMSPPSTPHFTISPTGTISNLVTGSHRPEMLIDEVMNAQNS